MAPGLSLPVSGTGLPSRWRIPDNPLSDPPSHAPTATPFPGPSWRQLRASEGPDQRALPQSPALGTRSFPNVRIAPGYTSIAGRWSPCLSTRPQI